MNGTPFYSRQMELLISLESSRHNTPLALVELSRLKIVAVTPLAFVESAPVGMGILFNLVHLLVHIAHYLNYCRPAPYRSVNGAICRVASYRSIGCFSVLD